MNIVVEWFNQYTLKDFLIHKLTHVATGFAVALGVSYFSHIVALLAVLAIAVGKEVADEYQSPAKIEYHILDVLVTMLGGVLGVLAQICFRIVF